MKALHQQVLMLGTRTGWSHREIVGLPRSVFDLYIDTLIKANGGEAD